MAITPKQFVQAWQTAASMGEVEQLTGMSKSAAQSRASAYRRRGVPLQKFLNSPRIDWAELALHAVDTEDLKNQQDSETEVS